MNTTAQNLDDPLDELFNGTPSNQPRKPVRQDVVDSVPEFSEICRSCRGSGRFTSYMGRDVGSCFKCKGAGKKSFKTSTDDRAKGRLAATQRKVNKAADAFESFKAEFVSEASWMLANPAFEFAVKMIAAVQKYGSLTEGQLAAVRRCIARNEQRAANRVQCEVSAPVVEGVDLLKASFDKAVAYSAQKGLRLSPRITIAGITISPAKANSKNPGALYVKAGNDYLGKIVNGRFHTVPVCTVEQQAKVLAFVANPAEAAKVYGQTTGTCCVCNATLISKWKHRGIGPICAEKFNW